MNIPPSYDAIIIGAGASGLKSAHDLEAKGYKVLMLEAGGNFGGRIQTIQTPNGSKANAGAHFCHGRDMDPAAHLAQSFGLKWTVDEAGNTSCYFGGKVHGAEFRNEKLAKLSEMLEEKRKTDPRADMSIRELIAKYPEDAVFADFWRRLWSSARNPGHFSIRDFLDDAFGAGGYLLKDGMHALLNGLHDRLRPDTLRSNTAVASITREGNVYTVTTAAGETIQTRAVVLTASVGVLQSGAIAMQSLLSPDMKEQLSDKNVAMGSMEKLVFDLPADFLARNPRFVDFHGELVESGFYIFAGHGGKPTLSVLIGGEQADEAGALAKNGNAEQVKHRFIEALRVNNVFPADCITYLEKQIPYLSGWGNNLHTRGAYSVSVVGGTRQPSPLTHDGFVIAGEAFSPHTGHVGGALRSGEMAADYLAQWLGPSLAATQKGPYASLLAGSGPNTPSSMPGSSFSPPAHKR